MVGGLSINRGIAWSCVIRGKPPPPNVHTQYKQQETIPLLTKGERLQSLASRDPWMCVWRTFQFSSSSLAFLHVFQITIPLPASIHTLRLLRLFYLSTPVSIDYHYILNNLVFVSVFFKNKNCYRTLLPSRRLSLSLPLLPPLPSLYPSLYSAGPMGKGGYLGSWSKPFPPGSVRGNDEIKYIESEGKAIKVHGRMKSNLLLLRLGF